MAELKKCRCGCDRTHIHTLQAKGIGWVCLIGCMSVVCDEDVIRYGLTKNHAKKRAVRAWNRRAEDGKM